MDEFWFADTYRQDLTNELSNATGYNYCVLLIKIAVFRALDTREKALQPLRAPDMRDNTIKFGMQIPIDKIPMKLINTGFLYK